MPGAGTGEAWTVEEHAPGCFMDARQPGLEVRQAGPRWELWFQGDTPRTGSFETEGPHRLDAWTIAAPSGHGRAVAQAIFDELEPPGEAWQAHEELHGLHDCEIAAICSRCLCCPVAFTPGCACTWCHCATNDERHGLTAASFEERVATRAEHLQRNLDAGHLGGG